VKNPYSVNHLREEVFKVEGYHLEEYLKVGYRLGINNLPKAGSLKVGYHREEYLVRYYHREDYLLLKKVVVTDFLRTNKQMEVECHLERR
jgi:hypothetical protein